MTAGVLPAVKDPAGNADTCRDGGTGHDKGLLSVRFRLSLRRERAHSPRTYMREAPSGPFWPAAGIYFVTAIAVLYVAASFSGELQKHVVPSQLGQVVVGLGAAAFLFYRSRLLGRSLPWLLMSVSMAFTQLATFVYLVYALCGHGDDAPWYLFAIYLLTYPLLFVALLLLSHEDRPPLPENRLSMVGRWLDSAIVLVGGGMAVVYVGLVPAAHARQGDSASLVFIACNAVLMLVMLSAATRYALLPGRTLRPKVKILLTSGVIGALSGFVLVGAQEASGGYVPGNSADGLYVIGLCSLAWAGYIGSRRRAEDDAAPHRIGLPVKSLLPLGAVMLGLTLLVLQVRGSMGQALEGAVLATVALVVLVVSRQVIAAVENGRLQAQKAALRTEKRFRSLVTNSSDIIVVIDPDTTISYSTPSAERLLGSQDIAGARLLDLLSPEVGESAVATIAGCLERPSANAGDRWLVRHGDGSWRHFDVAIVNLLDDPTVRGLVCTMRDIEERVRFEAQLERQVFYDPLTGLPNRMLFGDRLQHALARAKRTGAQIGVLFADLDDFKMVNDTGGHVLGDHLLIEVARRIEAVLRASDTPARLSGDEFAVLIEDLSDLLQATLVAEELLKCLRRPFRIKGSDLAVTVSIGLVLSDGDNSPEELLRHADTAMYEAKRAGGDRFNVFEPSMQAAIHRRLELQSNLRHAVAEREFVVHYQPVVDMVADTVIGVEALVRWEHPAGGLLRPADFLDVAEQSGLIIAIGKQVLEEACRQAKTWTDEVMPGSALRAAVNFSPRQLREPSVVSMIADILDSTGLDPGQFVVEVTEEALIEGEQPTSTKLWALKRLGVRLAIDDFGTGYSSLSRLSAFPFDSVKIDKQFVGRAGDGIQEYPVARTIIGLAQSLGLHAVAEGIEKRDQRDKLVALGCRFGQGYLFSEPIDAERMTAFLLAGRTAIVR
jgi:diguanylate cyclase (GGDEF)-like protein/PAS domain S-box-containing protein